ncbi:uncharacterized protein LOC115086176 isoform X2 [Rhinatrema bivittatum]|uniref:uncharacterized protein LOC115086176 isoform X2 n=1 Tax=Rhinatrema bivittatum TaxID=194408 RepID=UPI00112927AD|nr:uncharacterized protein LOC115086176 isoform X2 [Rhinatrema bivittatum]
MSFKSLKMLRGRLPNFTEGDVWLLSTLTVADEHHLYFRPGQPRDQDRANEAWWALREEFNAQSSFPREVEALKKRARRIRREDPGYLWDLWAHRRVEEVFSDDVRIFTEHIIRYADFPVTGQQDTSAEEEGDVPSLLSTPPPLSPSAPAMGDPAEMIFPPPSLHSLSLQPPSLQPHFSCPSSANDFPTHCLSCPTSHRG